MEYQWTIRYNSQGGIVAASSSPNGDIGGNSRIRTLANLQAEGGLRTRPSGGNNFAADPERDPRRAVYYAFCCRRSVLSIVGMFMGCCTRFGEEHFRYLVQKNPSINTGIRRWSQFMREWTRIRAASAFMQSRLGLRHPWIPGMCRAQATTSLNQKWDAALIVYLRKVQRPWFWNRRKWQKVLLIISIPKKSWARFLAQARIIRTNPTSNNQFNNNKSNNKNKCITLRQYRIDKFFRWEIYLSFLS